MKNRKFSIAHKDPKMFDLVKNTDQKILALWAIDCANRVLSYFEKKYPKDQRPQQALKTLKTWLKTGVFKMSFIRMASLDAHSAARDVEGDSPARSAARACGQAVATAHVPRHAYGSAVYAQQAIFRASRPSESEGKVSKERDWQYQRLVDLRKS